MSDLKPIEMSPRGIDESIGYHEEKNFEWGRITGKLEGLREAAQILSGYLKAGNTAGLQTGLLQDSLDDILARIAELEKP